jgi:hypothetical protein
MAVANILAYYVTATITAVKRFIVQAPGLCIIKLITVVIYSFRSKLECFSLNTRLGWRGLQGTNTLAYYGNRKLRL